MRHATRRVGWGLADQAVSSLTNFIVLIVAAGAVGRAPFGALAIALAAAATIVGISRAVAGEPLAVRFGGIEVARRSTALRGALGAATLVGVIGATVVAAAGIGIGGRVQDAMLPLALVLPGIVLQDAYRFALIASSRPRSAVVSDVTWLLAQCAAFAVMFSTGAPSLASVVLAWGGAATLAMAVAWARCRVSPDLRAARSWLREQHDLWPRFTGEILALTGAWQVALLGLGVVAGLESVGALRAAQVVVGPLNVAFLAVPLVLVPESSRAWRGGHGDPIRHSVHIGGALAGLALAWGALSLALPEAVGRELLGVSWPGARELVVPVTLVMASVGLTLGALTGLRVLGAARDSLHARLVTATAVVVAMVVGGSVGGASGAAWGWGVSAAAGSLVWWSTLQRAWRRHELAAPVSGLVTVS